MILFSLLSGRAGLEVRGPGVGQDLPVGLPHCVHTWNHPHLHPSPTEVPLVSSSGYDEGGATLQLRSTGIALVYAPKGIHVQKNHLEQTGHHLEQTGRSTASSESAPRHSLSRPFGPLGPDLSC